jgi:D-alanyl-D-alanine carboxypeptidase/D-alanyl-D-alanine-endopeptidase (penicillin-binding protein 4)
MKMKRSLVFSLAVTLVVQLIACAPAGKLKPNGKGLKALRARIDQILADSALAHSSAGIKIVSLRTGETFYERNSQLLFHPASNQKLLTTAAALGILGPAFEFPTRVACDSGALQNGVISGNLFLIGGGNPDLTSMELFGLAQQLKQTGVREVAGDLICDDFYFDDVRWGSGWAWDGDPAAYSPRLSALTVNKNVVDVAVAPGDSVGKLAKVSVEPPTDFVQVVNTSATVPTHAAWQVDALRLPPLIIDRRWQQNQNIIVVDGVIGMDQHSRRAEINVLAPELYAGAIFRDMLSYAGIKLNGRVARGLAPAKIQKLAEHRQPMMPTLINLNKVSDNLSAELVLKTIGAEKFGRRGNAANGLRAMRLFLSSAAVDTTAMRLADGSGLSRNNLITPAAIVDLLAAMWNNFRLRNEFISTLPVAGVDGLLYDRMHGTPAEGIVHAKTGTLNGVSALSGYAVTLDGEELVFSIMMQPFVAPTRAIREAQDNICVEICSFSRGNMAFK